MQNITFDDKKLIHSARFDKASARRASSGLRLRGRSDSRRLMRRKVEALKVIIVMPAYNAAQTLTWTINGIPPNSFTSIILVDDKSADRTLQIAKRLGLDVIALPHNIGYGGNQKICYLEALKHNADIIIMLHPDGQYEPEAINKFIHAIKKGNDIVLGSRFLSNPKRALSSGMPLYKFVANRFLTFIQNFVFGIKLSEWHTGYRAYNRKFLETVPFLRNSNDFVFDSEILAQAVYFRFRIGEISVKSRYFTEGSSINFWISSIYGVKTLIVLYKFVLSKARFISFGIFRK